MVRDSVSFKDPCCWTMLNHTYSVTYRQHKQKQVLFETSSACPIHSLLILVNINPRFRNPRFTNMSEDSFILFLYIILIHHFRAVSQSCVAHYPLEIKQATAASSFGNKTHEAQSINVVFLLPRWITIHRVGKGVKSNLIVIESPLFKPNAAFACWNRNLWCSDQFEPIWWLAKMGVPINHPL